MCWQEQVICDLPPCKSGEAANEAARDCERRWTSGCQALATGTAGGPHWALVRMGIVLSEGSCDPSAALKIRVSCCESQEGQLDISASWLEMDAAVGAEGSRV